MASSPQSLLNCASKKSTKQIWGNASGRASVVLAAFQMEGCLLRGLMPGSTELLYRNHRVMKASSSRKRGEITDGPIRVRVRGGTLEANDTMLMASRADRSCWRRPVTE